MDMTIKIVTVGNKPKHELSSLITDYTKRFPQSVSIVWHYLKHAPADDVSTSKHQESESILRVILDSDFVILLDETGKQLDSPAFSKLVFETNRDFTFIIGGAYGVSESVTNRANFILSLSKLVFPHQIVRLLLAEQLYRAYAISSNHPYHHA